MHDRLDEPPPAVRRCPRGRAVQAVADPVDSAIETLAAEFEQIATRDGNVITITDEVRSVALQRRLRAVGLAQNSQAVAAVASGKDHRVTCAWVEPHLVFVFETPQNIHMVRCTASGRADVAEHPDDELPKPKRWMKNDPPPRTRPRRSKPPASHPTPAAISP